MTRLNGKGNGGRIWLWIILIVILIIAVLLVLDYFNTLPFHLLHMLHLN